MEIICPHCGKMNKFAGLYNKVQRDDGYIPANGLTANGPLRQCVYCDAMFNVVDLFQSKSAVVVE